MNVRFASVLLLVAVIIISAAIAAAYQIPHEKNDAKDGYAYIELNDKYEWGEAVKFIRENGGKVTATFPQYHVIYAYNLNKAILDSDYIKKYSYGEVKSDNRMASIWNRGFEVKEKIVRDGIKFDYPDSASPRLDTEKSKDYRYEPTSEYMIGSEGPYGGDILVEVIMTESNGEYDSNIENWTTAKEDKVMWELTGYPGNPEDHGGILWWGHTIKNFSDRHNLNFIINFNYRKATGYEPITRPGGYTDDVYLWMSDVLGRMGYSGVDWYDVNYEFLLDKMQNPYYHDPAWGFVIWVVDSEVDEDGKFSNGFHAWAELGGPYFVMTYDNGGYTINRMDEVSAHETGHIFWALDQYTSSNCVCTERSGYLNVENQNCKKTGCSLNEDSIMRGDPIAYTNHYLDQYGAWQIGWKDSDGDGIFDILDTNPETTLIAYSPDPTGDNTPNYQGSAFIVPYPNNNPWGFNPQEDISVNYLDRVEINPWPTPEWLFASASDGNFNEGNENFILLDSDWPFGLSNGVYTFKARAVDNWGHKDNSYATDVLTISRTYPTSPGGGGKLPEMPAEPDGFVQK